MGGPKASRAIRTMSIARTTPAQNPRGFNKSSVLSLPVGTIKVPLGYTSPLWIYIYYDTGKNQFGQRKVLKLMGLAWNGANRAANGITRFPGRRNRRRPHRCLQLGCPRVELAPAAYERSF